VGVEADLHQPDKMQESNKQWIRTFFIWTADIICTQTAVFHIFLKIWYRMHPAA